MAGGRRLPDRLPFFDPRGGPVRHWKQNKTLANFLKHVFASRVAFEQFRAYQVVSGDVV